MRERMYNIGTGLCIVSVLGVGLSVDEYAYDLVEWSTWLKHAGVLMIPALVGAAIMITIKLIDRYEENQRWWTQYEEDMAELEALRYRAERDRKFKELMAISNSIGKDRQEVTTWTSVK